VEWITARRDATAWSWERTPALLEGQRVLVVGEGAQARGFLGLLRRFGARIVPCRDVETARLVLQRLVVDIVVVDSTARCDDGRTLRAVVRTSPGPSVHATFVAPPTGIGLATNGVDVDPRADRCSA